jgi:AcrR family transcriptional regulator
MLIRMTGMSVSDDLVFRAVLNVWNDWGLTHTTLKRISNAVGVGEATLLRRFGSKAGLLRSAFALEAAKLCDECVVTGNLRSDLERLVEGYRHLMRRRGRLVFDLILEAPRRDEASAIVPIGAEALNRSAAVIAHYQSSGALRGDNPWEPLLALIGPLILPALQRDPQRRLYPASTGNVDEFLGGWARQRK